MDSCFSKSARDLASPFNCIAFDLDDTLYSSKSGIADSLKKNIDDFIVDKFGFEEKKASNLRVELFKTYGSSLAGLRALGHDIDADDYHSYVHGRLPYHLIKRDAQLQNILRSIPQRKIIFTNSDRIHAVRVLKQLGLEDCFDQIICFETMNPHMSQSTRPEEFPVVLKPSLEAMNIAIHVADIDPPRTLFLDDNVRNVAAGNAVGFRTVLVGKSSKTKEADYAIEAVTELAKVVPEIWASDPVVIGRGRSEMESVVAPTPVGA